MVAGRRAAARPPTVPLDSLSTPVARRAPVGPPRTPVTPTTPGTPGTPRTPVAASAGRRGLRGRRPTSWTPAEDERLSQLVAAEAAINRNSVNAAAFAKENLGALSSSSAAGGDAPAGGPSRDLSAASSGAAPRAASWSGRGSPGMLPSGSGRGSGRGAGGGEEPGCGDLQASSGGVGAKNAASYTHVAGVGGGAASMSQAEAASVTMTSTKTWSLIASQLPGRTGKQCRERWLNQLKPGINREPWTEEEQRILYEAHARLGNKWVQIAELLPGRTDNTVKNFFNSAQRKAQRRRAAQQMLERLDAEAVRRLKPSVHSPQCGSSGGRPHTDPSGPSATTGDGLGEHGANTSSACRTPLNFTSPHHASTPPPSSGPSPGVSPPSTFAAIASSPSPPPSGSASPQQHHLVQPAALSGAALSGGGYLTPSQKLPGIPVCASVQSGCPGTAQSGGSQGRNAKLEIAHIMSAEPGQHEKASAAAPANQGSAQLNANRPSISPATSSAPSPPASCLIQPVVTGYQSHGSSRPSPVGTPVVSPGPSPPSRPSPSPVSQNSKLLHSLVGSARSSASFCNTPGLNAPEVSTPSLHFTGIVSQSLTGLTGHSATKLTMQRHREGRREAQGELERIEGSSEEEVLASTTNCGRCGNLPTIDVAARPAPVPSDVRHLATSTVPVAVRRDEGVRTRASRRNSDDCGRGKRNGGPSSPRAGKGDVGVKTRGIAKARHNGPVNALNALAMAASAVPPTGMKGKGRGASSARAGATGANTSGP